MAAVVEADKIWKLEDVLEKICRLIILLLLHTGCFSVVLQEMQDNLEMAVKR